MSEAITVISQLHAYPMSAAYIIPNLPSSTVDVSCDEVMRLACVITGANDCVLTDKNRVYEVKYARWLVMHVLYHHSWSKVRIARLFNMHHTTIMYALRQIEDERETNKQYAGWMERMERFYSKNVTIH